jgi:hypothetical protein
VLRRRDRAAGSRYEEDVDLFAVGQLAHARDDVERALAVGVNQDDARALHGRTCHQHGERNVDHDVSTGSQSPSYLFGLGGGIADE